jgi:hypothetical protein
VTQARAEQLAALAEVRERLGTADCTSIEQVRDAVLEVLGSREDMLSSG